MITDKFHVCRYVTWALENVRKSEQKKFSDERRKYFKRSRWILLSRHEKLTEEQCQQLENMLAVSEKLRKAYWLKENFYVFIDSKDIYEAKKNLKNWNLCAGVAQLEEFQKCFEIINRWQHNLLYVSYSRPKRSAFCFHFLSTYNKSNRLSYSLRRFDIHYQYFFST